MAIEKKGEPGEEGKAMKLKGVIFDMDGTVVDVPYDWAEIKRNLGTGGKPILAFITGLSEPDRSRKMKILEAYESRATGQAVLKKGIPELLKYLRAKKIKIALVTNNSGLNVSILLERFQLKFDLIISRESRLWKPDGAPFLEVLKSWGIAAESCAVVGDSLFDVMAAENAGISQVYLLGWNGNDDIQPRAEICTSAAELKKRLGEIISGI